MKTDTLIDYNNENGNKISKNTLKNETVKANKFK